MKVTKLILLCVCLLFCHFESIAQHVARVKPTKVQKDSLKNELNSIIASDQQYRIMIAFGEMEETKLAEMQQMEINSKMKRMSDARSNKVGIPQFQKDSLWNLQNEIDSINFRKLSGIIYRFGFPNGYIDPIEVSTILLHTGALLTDDFFQMLMQEVKNRNLPGLEYATIYDRTQLERKLPELYYVIDHYDSVTKTFTFRKPLDFEATNKARKEIGLKKIRE